MNAIEEVHMKKLTLALAAIAAAVLATGAATAPRPSSYTIPGNAVFPEGIAYQDGTNRFYVGSTTDGTIFRGRLPRRPMSSFLPGGADGRTTAIGMKVANQGRLFIAGGGTGAVWVYDTKARKLIRRFESGFSGQQFLNDLVIAKNGDVFVTDSFRPVLYRIPAAAVVSSATPGALEAWLDFTSTTLVYQPGFNLNGIVATQDGKYLVVVQSNTGKLYRSTSPARPSWVTAYG
jgi:Cu-Zn family superoxide dismutase